MNDEAASHGRRPRLVVTYYPIDCLKPDPRNPQKHSRKQIKKIAKSIRAFHFNSPVLVDRDLNILAGHGRWEASKSLGMTEIATIRLEHLSAAQARAFMIADNQLTKSAAWDGALLAEHLKALSAPELDLDFDLEATGFDLDEIELRIDGFDGRKPDGEKPDGQKPSEEITVEELPAVPSIPVTQPGDVWRMGEHRLLCANALEAASYDQLMAGERADVVFAAPPADVLGEVRAAECGGIAHWGLVLPCGEPAPRADAALLERAMALMARHSQDGSLHFLCVDWRYLLEVLQAARQVCAAHENTCVWVWDKPAADTGSPGLYRCQHELVCVFRHGHRGHSDHAPQARLRRNRANVWHYPAGAAPRGDHERTDGGVPLHLAAKPIAMIADALTDCSGHNALVLDPFAGAGSTLIAAERTGRRARLMERDPKFVDVIIQRWERLTGGSALHVASGQTYTQRRKS